MAYTKYSLILIFCIANSYFVYWSRLCVYSYKDAQDDINRPPLYLPELKYVKLVTLGYNTLVSDVLWFNTLNYFGKELIAGRDNEWLGHMCELVTTLDPKALHVYEFCSTLLSWIVHKVELSNVVLSRGISANPNYWRLYYLRGFNSWYFNEDLDSAREDFIVASKLADAPEFLSGLASRLLAKTRSSDSAVKFLEEMEKRANNESVKKALAEKRKEATIGQHIAFLREGLRRYMEKNGHFPSKIEDLVTDHIITNLPEEPYGGSYSINEEGEIRSSSGHRGLDFISKTSIVTNK